MFTGVAFFCPRLRAKPLRLFGHCLLVGTNTVLSFTILLDLLLPLLDCNFGTFFLSKKLGLNKTMRTSARCLDCREKESPLRQPLVALSASGAVFQSTVVPCSFFFATLQKRQFRVFETKD
jgi:hypothetical protein